MCRLQGLQPYRLENVRNVRVYCTVQLRSVRKYKSTLASSGKPISVSEHDRIRLLNNIQASLGNKL